MRTGIHHTFISPPTCEKAHGHTESGVFSERLHLN